MKLSRMLNLIRNENMKLYGRVGTWVMIGLLCLAVIGAGIIIKTTSKTAANTAGLSIFYLQIQI